MKNIVWTLIILIIIIGGIYSFNYFSLKQPTWKELDADKRNTGIEISVHYKNCIFTNTLVFDVKDVADNKAIADVFRVFLQTAYALRGKKFETVELTCKGEPKFMLDGDYFKKLGDEYKFQNSVYTLRTFPEHVSDMEGRAVYSKWTGGMLGVLNKQMEDFKDFNEKWYLDELKDD